MQSYQNMPSRSSHQIMNPSSHMPQENGLPYFDPIMLDNTGTNQPINIIIFIIQCINIAIAIAFLVFFLKRFLKLRHDSITNAYIHQYPYSSKLFLPLTYIIISCLLLAFQIITNQHNNDIIAYFLQGGFGQCINSVILILHAIVLKQELVKQQHYTKLHQMYMFWLAFLSISRVIFSSYFLYSGAKQQEQNKKIYTLGMNLAFSFLLMILSLAMLAIWLKKKRQLPDFVDANQINLAQSQNPVVRSLNSGLLSHDYASNRDPSFISTKARIFDKRLTNRNDNIYTQSIATTNKITPNNHNSANYLFPTVMVERGQIRIIIQGYASDSILSKSVLHSDPAQKDNNMELQQNMQVRKHTAYRKKKVQKYERNTAPNGSGQQKHNNEVNGVQSKHLQIISNNVYKISQLYSIYLQCSRFDSITTVPSFPPFNEEEQPTINMTTFYPSIKKYIAEVFSLPQSYTYQILSLFHISKESISQIITLIQKKTNNHHKATEVSEPFYELNEDASKTKMISANRDKVRGQQKVITDDESAMFISLSIYKFLWNKDHYIFYIRSNSSDGKDKCVCYRRYREFQDLHNHLCAILDKQHHQHHQNKMSKENTKSYINYSKYKLPHLPKKHAFISPSQARVRQKELQKYLRELANDYQIMMYMPAARQCILNFLNFSRIFAVTPPQNQFKRIYTNIQIRKGTIENRMVLESGQIAWSGKKSSINHMKEQQCELVTFYEFLIYQRTSKKDERGGMDYVLVKKIEKRFREFISLHQNLQRYMHNTQIVYKNIVLPEKHRLMYSILHGQTRSMESQRHESLLRYLTNIVTGVNNVQRFYTVSNFLGVSLSDVASDQKDDLSVSEIVRKDDEKDSESFKKRMSYFIDELGQDGDNI